MTNKIYALLSLILVGMGLLYYYGIAKPADIRESCYNEMDRNWSLASDRQKAELGYNLTRISEFEREQNEFAYRGCLRRNGLSD